MNEQLLIKQTLKTVKHKSKISNSLKYAKSQIFWFGFNFLT